MMRDDFEDFLASQPLRPIPPEWRAEILRAAREAAPEPGVPWWRALLWPSPLAWAGVGCAWVLVIAMNLASRPSARDEISGLPQGTKILALIVQEQQSLIELSQLEARPTAPPRKPMPAGASSAWGRREDLETA